VTIARLLVDHSVAMVRQERLVESLQQAENRATKLALELITCGVVGQAIGILMTKHKTPRNEALFLLHEESHTSNHKLHEVASDVVRTGELKRPSRSRTIDRTRRGRLRSIATGQ
jgi:AmiR/NasT family two-component response regulator